MLRPPSRRRTGEKATMVEEATMVEKATKAPRQSMTGAPGESRRRILTLALKSEYCRKAEEFICNLA